jgi:cell division protein FtsI/penicillin-binding protein 2
MSSGWRIYLLFALFLLVGFLIETRLFYWQIIKSSELVEAAQKQHWVSFEILPKRGEILASDGFPLAANKEAYLVFASLPDLKDDPARIAAKIAPFLAEENQELETELQIKQRLERADLVWVPLKHKIPTETKNQLEKLNLAGLGFEKESRRDYPEASSAAHLLGFVGSDINGRDKGYQGLEGYYDLELKGRSGLLKREKDASGRPILVGETKQEKEYDGRSLLTTIDRAIQYLLEEKLMLGLKRYGAKSGTIVIMEPRTGAILGMVSLPSYDPANYFKYDQQLFPNPAIATAFEPGSIFKVLVMASALDTGVVKPETICDQCSGPRTISGYQIKTWNEKYFPNCNMIEVIQHSDNVGMVFVGEKLGSEKLVNYLKSFGIGEPTGIDLEEEGNPGLRPLNDWKEIDLATASFGQGVALTPLQMVRAVGAIANQGKLVKPFVVSQLIGQDESVKITNPPAKEVIKPTTALTMTEILVNAVANGEAKWAKPPGFKIAGKTGTAQIPIAGHYDKEKTIASFVGYAPADNPKFVMLVTLQEPTSSPWGSETAAPLWFEIAQELFTYFGILPE